MARNVINLNNGHLIRISPVFPTLHPGSVQKVEVIYTDDRSDPIWAGESSSSSGVCREAKVDEENKILHGIIGIELSGKMKPKSGSLVLGSSQVRFSKPTLDEVREEIFKTLTHELLHVIQGWVWGKEWETRHLEARQEVYSKDPFGQEQLVKEGIIPYTGYQNRYELAAYRYGHDWVSEHRAELKAGKYNDLIPLSTIESLLAVN